MSVNGDETLVTGIASSASFDLTESHAVLEEHGEDAYRDFQEVNYDSQLSPENAYVQLRKGLIQVLDLNHQFVELAPIFLDCAVYATDRVFNRIPVG